MKPEWKGLFRIAVVAFLLFLGIHYWPNAARLFTLILAAAAPLISGCIIAYLINILMSFYERHYFPKKSGKAIEKSKRPVCLISAVLTLLLIIALVVLLVVPQLMSGMQLLLDELSLFASQALERLSSYEWAPEQLKQFQIPTDWESRLTDLFRFLTSGLGDMMGFVAGTVTTVFSGATSALLGIIFAFYLLSGKERLQKQFSRLLCAVLPEERCKRVRYVLSVLNDCFHRYIVGQCIEALILGGLCTLGMLLFRFPYATMIGALVAFTALIPVVGAFIGAGVGAFMILVVSPFKALMFLIFLVILQQLEGNIIYPRVVGSSIGLPGIWVLAAVTIGGSLLGIFGMLLAVPTAAAAYRLGREALAAREKALA